MEGDLIPGSAMRPEPDAAFGPQPQSAAIPLPQILDLTRAVSLRDSLATWLAGPGLRLDANPVERMSTPCAQLLLAAGRAAGSSGVSFTIINASTAFRTAIADLGLQPEFSKWMD